MLRRLCILAVLWCAPASATKAPRLELHGTVAELPASEPCTGKISRVTVLYRVEQLVAGSYADHSILVVHRCPELARGPSRIGRGDAGAIKVGRTYLLALRPVDPKAPLDVVDPFKDDSRPRYKPLRTDPSSWPPRMVVVVEGGGGGLYKLPFDSHHVSVGRAADSDVLLAGQAVAPRHLELWVDGGQVVARPLGGAPVKLHGKPLHEPRKITFKDRIGVGSYTLRVALFLGSDAPLP